MAGADAVMAAANDFAVFVAAAYGYAAETAAAAACVPAVLHAAGDDLPVVTAAGDENVKVAVCVPGGKAVVQKFVGMTAATGANDAVESGGRENPE